MPKYNDNGDDGGFFTCIINVQNNNEPIDALFEHPVFKGHLQRISLAVAPNATEAEDLYSEACLKLIRNIYQFDPTKGSFVGWLRTMVQNLNTDRFRRKSLVLDDTPSDERYDLRHPGADPFEQFRQRELTKKLNELIAKQEEPERLILTYYFQDLSFREIKEILETEHGIYITHVTVRTKVRKLLEEFFDTNLSKPDVDRKADKLSKKRPAEKAQINRKAEKVSKRRRVSTRRIALKK